MKKREKKKKTKPWSQPYRKTKESPLGRWPSDERLQGKKNKMTFLYMGGELEQQGHKHKEQPFLGEIGKERFTSKAQKKVLRANQIKQEERELFDETKSDHT